LRGNWRRDSRDQLTTGRRGLVTATNSNCHRRHGSDKDADTRPYPTLLSHVDIPDLYEGGTDERRWRVGSASRMAFGSARENQPRAHTKSRDRHTARQSPTS
jgi:hypothetical protein